MGTITHLGHAYGTGFKMTRGGFAQIIGGRAMCADGRVRTLAHLGEPDTVWTRPAAVKVRGRYVRGFVEMRTGSGSSTPMPHDPAYLAFIADAGIRGEVFPGAPTSWAPPHELAARQADAEEFAAWLSSGADYGAAFFAGCRAGDKVRAEHAPKA